MALNLRDKEDLIQKALEKSWVVGLGAVLVLIAFVLLLNKFTPHPLGH